MRRLVQIALLLLLLIHLGGPPFETVDHWDQFAQGGDDFVLSVLRVAVGLGLTVVLALFLLWIFLVLIAKSVLSLIPLRRDAGAYLGAPRPAPFASPPLPLRI